MCVCVLRCGKVYGLQFSGVVVCVHTRQVSITDNDISSFVVTTDPSPWAAITEGSPSFVSLSVALTSAPYVLTTVQAVVSLLPASVIFEILSPLGHCTNPSAGAWQACNAGLQVVHAFGTGHDDG